MTDAQYSFFYKLKYYSYFVARAFLISIFCFLIIFALLFTVYLIDLFVNVKSGNYKAPLFGGYVIVSPSMVPTININDAIVVKRSGSGQYNIGDIISFFSTEYNAEGNVITHRVIKKNEVYSTDSYVTKGDNNPVPDKKRVSSSNIYGKVFLIIPKLGYLQNFLSNPLNFALCLLVPAGFIFLYEIIRIRKAIIQSKNFS
ncbi:MAG: signal peptidase I [Bacilli bacterium]|nr:signal peptidase I [Bacilli bacterium]